MTISSKRIKVTLRANTYYYEQGNIQFSLGTKFNGNTSGSDNKAIAESLVEFIKKRENSF